MPTVYLDYNIIAKVAGFPVSPVAEAWREAIKRLSGMGYHFALSGWHAYELAKSDNEQHVDACCRFVEEVSPIWLSNNIFVKRDELARFRGSMDGNAGQPVRAFNQVISQMWATHGPFVIIGESFRNTVEALRISPGALEEINNAASETPRAIQDSRDALAEGRYALSQNIVDRVYFADLVNRHDTEYLEYILDHIDQVFLECPTIAIEEQLTKIRVRDNFQPTDSDAADLQHALVALAYCDHFVSDDKRLVRHSKEAVQTCGLPCYVHRNPTTIQ